MALHLEITPVPAQAASLHLQGSESITTRFDDECILSANPHAQTHCVRPHVAMRYLQSDVVSCNGSGVMVLLHNIAGDNSLSGQHDTYMQLSS